MTWPESYFNYRIVKGKDKDGTEYYGVFEMHYSHGEEVATNEHPVIVGDSVEELKRVMIQLMDAFERPIYQAKPEVNE